MIARLTTLHRRIESPTNARDRQPPMQHLTGTHLRTSAPDCEPRRIRESVSLSNPYTYHTRQSGSKDGPATSHGDVRLHGTTQPMTATPSETKETRVNRTTTREKEERQLTGGEATNDSKKKTLSREASTGHRSNRQSKSKTERQRKHRKQNEKESKTPRRL